MLHCWQQNETVAACGSWRNMNLHKDLTICALKEHTVHIKIAAKLKLYQAHRNWFSASQSSEGAKLHYAYYYN
jgi:hypothetical protein